MIKLGEFEFDSADSGAGTIEVISESDKIWIRIHKESPDKESHRPIEKRDPEQWKVIELSSRNLTLLNQNNTRHIGD